MSLLLKVVNSILLFKQQIKTINHFTQWHLFVPLLSNKLQDYKYSYLGILLNLINNYVQVNPVHFIVINAVSKMIILIILL